MDLFATCDQCRSTAIVIRHVYKPGELAEIARTLELDEPVNHYMIIACHKCGIRAIDPPSTEPASQKCV